ncbi:MAG: TetR family transcriptional regulator [Holophagae bacterium]|jgi:AcrR family transcriptional regulator
MNSNTRERLLVSATRLFADAGYRGAPVRDICNLARANPGAVSYHFGGKRQLYRSALRRAAEGLANLGPGPGENGELESVVDPSSAADAILRRMEADDTSARLLLRDLADGGAVAVESLAPPLRAAFEQLAVSLGHGDDPHASPEAKRVFLALAAAIYLFTTAWPLLSAALGLDENQRRGLLNDLAEGAIRGLGPEGQP